MKWFVNSMFGYWVLLLVVSLGAAAGIYEVWLRDRM
jgi:hypothetical protein